MWTPAQAAARRRARFVRDQEDYIQACGLVNDGLIKEEWSRFVLGMMPPITWMGSFNFPAEFGGPARRRWTFYRFMEERLREGHYLAAEEPHQSGDIHFHAVGAGYFRHLSMHDSWEMATRCGHEWRGGFARIEPPKSVDDVVGYCVKYVAKGHLSGRSDLRLGTPAPQRAGWEHLVKRGFNPPWRPPQPGAGLSMSGQCELPLRAQREPGV